MMPFWMFTLGSQITADGGNIQVPYQGIVSSLLVLTTPSVIGMVLRWWKPHWKDYSDRSIRPMVGILLFIFCTVRTRGLLIAEAAQTQDKFSYSPLAVGRMR